MSRSDKILIVGAGIGGLCAAIALARNGAEVDVIDIKPDNAVAGVGWGLRTNGLRALRQIGLLEETLKIGFPTPPLTYYDRHGEHIVDISYGRKTDDLPNNVQLPRLGFLEIASARAKELGCNIMMATTAADIQQDDAAVTVELSDGSSHRYDLVIGFDGINSQNICSARNTCPSAAAGLPGALRCPPPTHSRARCSVMVSVEKWVSCRWSAA